MKNQYMRYLLLCSVAFLNYHNGIASDINEKNSRAPSRLSQDLNDLRIQDEISELRLKIKKRESQIENLNLERQNKENEVDYNKKLREKNLKDMDRKFTQEAEFSTKERTIKLYNTYMETLQGAEARNVKIKSAKLDYVHKVVKFQREEEYETSGIFTKFKRKFLGTKTHDLPTLVGPDDKERNNFLKSLEQTLNPSSISNNTYALPNEYLNNQEQYSPRFQVVNSEDESSESSDEESLEYKTFKGNK